jgi:hypothetical protein
MAMGLEGREDFPGLETAVGTALGALVELIV